MRKHDVRKWLHAILDLLPVILIPVFMIYSHRHEINDGSIQVQEKLAIDFNQNVNIRDFSTTFNGIDYVVSNGFVTANGTSTARSNLQVFLNRPTAIDGSHQCLIKGVSGGSASTYYISLVYYLNNSYVTYTTFTNETIFYMPNGVDSFQLECVACQQSGQVVNDLVFAPQIYDLTKMFGVGNEPTISAFNQLFPNDYYAYVVSDKFLVDGDLVTYDDTDIMSQFTYQLYNSVDKYFNMGNVFHLNEVYDWFNLNIFNGQAPIYIFIVYQIVLYELIMDLLMLLYALFMWFIDMIEKLMEKPLNSIK